MAEYIEKGDIYKITSVLFTDEPTRKIINEIIEKFPAANVAPVVYCKDCKHWNPDKASGWCSEWDDVVENPDFFYGAGERKQEEEI